jgi:molybdopterin biosynthesis enzyme
LVRWHGSADLAALAAATALAHFPADKLEYHDGESIEVIPLDGGW